MRPEDLVKRVISRHRAIVEMIPKDKFDTLLKYHSRGVCLYDCPLCDIDREAFACIVLSKFGLKIGDTDVKPSQSSGQPDPPTNPRAELR